MEASSIVLGTINGLSYGILAVGLVLIYRANRFVNFAHGSLGSLVAVLFFKFVVDFDVPYFLALLGAMALAGLLGGLVELTVIRRLFDAPPLVLVVATIALAQLFFFFSLLEQVQPNPTTLARDGFPVPFEASITVAGVILSGPHLAIISIIPVLALAVTGFLRFTAYGQAIRAAADNPDAARLAGISIRRMSTIVWVIAGVLAGVTAVLFISLRASTSVSTMGPSVLVRALGAALIGRMVSLPIAFGASIGIGVIEAVVFNQYGLSSGPAEVAVFGVVMVALAVRGRQLSRTTRDQRTTSVGFGAELPALRRDLAELPAYQRLRRATMTAIGLVVVGAPFLPVFGLDSSEKLSLLAVTAAFGIVAVSLTVLTGWAGQVSLGQFALVGVGAAVTARFDELAMVPVVLLAGVAAALVSILVGIPALRIQGLFLAVSTLAFGVLATQWVFQEELFVLNPSGVYLDRPGIIGTERAVYFFALGMLALCVWMARNLRRSGPGRLLLAVRDNDAAARSAGVSPMWSRMLAFAIAGFMAGIAGAVFSYSRLSFVAVDYPPAMSLQVLLMVAVGGLGSLTGALLGAVFMFGLPALFGSSELLTLFTSSVGVLVVLLYLPGGLGSIVVMARDSVAERLHRKAHGLAPPPRTRPTFAQLWSVVIGRRRSTVPEVADT